MFSFNPTLTTTQRLERAVNSLMSHDRYVVVAGVFMIGERKIEDGLPTAATNGRDEYYGKKFVDEVLVDDACLRFVVLHENQHKVRRHLLHYQWMYDIDPDLANRACDYVINLSIVDENPDGFVKMPMVDGKPLGLLDTRFRGMDEAQVFNILRDEQKQQQQQPQPSNGMDSHDWAGAKDLGKDEQKQLAQDIDEAVRQGVINASKMGKGTGGRAIQELLAVEVDWREVTREFFSTVCRGDEDATWRTLNRRYMAAGILRPGRISERMEDIVIAVDTSASIAQEHLTKFLSEVIGMLEAVMVTRVHLLYWDTRVRAAEVYGADYAPVAELASSTKPAGGGGTNVECVTDYLRANHIDATAAVVFTDGYLAGSWGNWNMDVLWCVLNNKAARPAVGKTVHIRM
jgi:predicted metal-dependent peptidase